MDYEKKYKEALTWMQSLYDGLHGATKEDAEHYFPELKESEDEKILRHLKAVVKAYDMWTERGLSMNDVLTWLEKQGEQKQDPCDNCKDVMLNCHNFPCTKKRAFKQGKSVLEVIKEDPLVYKTKDGEIITFSETNGYKLVPNFKVRYAGREYDVLKVKDVSGVRFYGIEDEPNHIDYVKAENCERVDGYSMKENGSAYPTKSAMFSEQPTTDKIEPKFHEGDWLCENAPNNYARFIQILEIVNVQGKERYRISRDIHNDEDVVECRFIENNYHSFTIADVKAGDVLVYKENIKGSNGIKYERICLFNNFDNAFFILTTVSNDVEGYDIDVNINYPDDTIPATKDQREQLENAMADAGYAFDFDKKEFKKIEQKPAWSEEDKKTLERVIRCIENHDYMNVDDIHWFKSLKDRVGCEANCTTTKEWKPSDEQMEALKEVTNIVGCKYKSYLNSLYSDLKKLRKE